MLRGFPRRINLDTADHQNHHAGMHGVTVWGAYRRNPPQKQRGRNQSQARKKKREKRNLRRMQKRKSPMRSRRKMSQMLVNPLFMHFKMTFRVCRFNKISKDYFSL